MNQHNAVYLLDQELQVVFIQFSYKDDNLFGKSVMKYTYLSRTSWPDMQDLSYGDVVLVPAKSTKPNSIGYFAGYGELTDLDIDATDIDYLYVFGGISNEWVKRRNTAHEEASMRLTLLKKERIKRMQEQVVQHLIGELSAPEPIGEVVTPPTPPISLTHTEPFKVEGIPF